MSLFDFILSLLLVFNPSMPESTFDQVYSILDDTQIRSVLVDDSAVEALAELAGNAEIMPLEFGQSDSGTLNNINNALYAGGNSVANWNRTINQSIVDFRGDLADFVESFNEHAIITSQIYDFLVSPHFENGLKGILTESNRYTRSAASSLLNLTTQNSNYLTVGSGWYGIRPDGSIGPIPQGYSLIAFLNEAFIGLHSMMTAFPGWIHLYSDGTIQLLSDELLLPALINDGFLGLASLMSGSDRSTSFSFLKEDLSGSDDLTADNLLDAFGLVGTQLQNPLQRLAYVLANPQDIQIRDDVSANVDQAQQDFFKGDGGGSVKPDNIKDAAGISGGAAGALESPGTVGDLTAQINNQDNFSFFSDVTLGNLDSVPATHSDGDDFIDFYDPSNPALWEALSNEPVS